MKKHSHKLIICSILFLFLLVGCANHNYQSEGETAQVANNVTAVELAKLEFNTIFSEFAELEITETATSARADDESHIVVEITYTSANASGTYGFEYDKDTSGNYSLIEHGEDVSVYNLTE